MPLNTFAKIFDRVLNTPLSYSPDWDILSSWMLDMVQIRQSIQEWTKLTFLKAVFHKFYLVYFRILCAKYTYRKRWELWTWVCYVNSRRIFQLPHFKPKLYFHTPENAIKSKHFWCFQAVLKWVKLDFYYLKIIRFLRPRYHPKIVGHIQESAKKQACLF